MSEAGLHLVAGVAPAAQPAPKRLSVVGLGKLGSPMAAVFAKKGFEVIGVDVNPVFVEALNAGRAPVQEPDLQELIDQHGKRITATTSYREAVLATDVTFIIVPTPSKADFFFSNDFVLKAIEEIGAALCDKQDYHLVVVTSTVMPGSTGGVIRETLEAASGRKVGDELGLCYNPEFIALGSVVRDMLQPDMILIGQSDEKAGLILESIYRSSIDTHAEFQRMNWVNAELCKIAVNTYVTTKISYANMIADMCDRLGGADADVVTRALGADSRIGRKYIKGATGYGGPCFPRDNKAFVALARSIGARADLAEATDQINNYQVTRLIETVGRYAEPGATVAVLGLSYKPNTQVVEESHGVFLANALAAAGYLVRAYDPQAWRNGLSGKVARAESVLEAASGATVAVIMTAWPEFANVDFRNIVGSNNLTIIDPWHTFGDAKDLGVRRYLRLGALLNG